MRQNNLVRIRHALDAAKKAAEFLKDKTKDDLHKNEMLSLAVVRLLEVIGESVAGLDSALKNQHAEIPWKEMTAMRNRLIHGYFDIDLDIVWSTVAKDLPPLVSALEKLLDEIAKAT